MDRKENFREAMNLIEKSGILNHNINLGQLIEVAKQVDILHPGEEVGEWSVLIYKCFVLASGLSDEEAIRT